MNNIAYGASSKTLIIECGHFCEYDPLYAGLNYGILVGVVCDECGGQYFWS